MADWKLTFLFNSGIQGWSETFYFPCDTIEDAEVRATRYSDQRLTCLASNVEYMGCRISNDIVFGDSHFVQPVPNRPAIAAGALAKDIPGAALLLRMEAGSLYRRSLLLRGLPDEYIAFHDVSGKAAFPVPLLGRLAVLKLAILKIPLGQDALRIKVIDKGTTPKAIEKKITKITREPVTNYAVLTVPNHGLLATDGDRVRIRSVSGDPFLEDLNGVFQIESNTPTTITIPKTIGIGDINYTVKGKCHFQSYVYVQITSVDPIRYGTRDTGRPFGATAGRRPDKKE